MEGYRGLTLFSDGILPDAVRDLKIKNEFYTKLAEATSSSTAETHVAAEGADGEMGKKGKKNGRGDAQGTRAVPNLASPKASTVASKNASPASSNTKKTATPEFKQNLLSGSKVTKPLHGNDDQSVIPQAEPEALEMTTMIQYSILPDGSLGEATRVECPAAPYLQALIKYGLVPDGVTTFKEATSLPFIKTDLHANVKAKQAAVFNCSDEVQEEESAPHTNDREPPEENVKADEETKESVLEDSEPSIIDTTESDWAVVESESVIEERQLLNERHVAAANADWPWIDCPPQLLLEAPFALNRYNSPDFFQLPEMNAHCKYLSFPLEVQYQIYAYLFENHLNAAAFARTCQKAFNQISRVCQHWDMSRANFLDADVERKDSRAKCPGKIIIASPVRMRDTHITAHHEMCALHRLTRGFHQWADKFEIILLHRIPLLTLEVLDHVIPHMRNLKVLGIYRCSLIHFGHTAPLMTIVAKAHGIETHKAPAKLDFWPRFHVGPKSNLFHPSIGSFGVTWGDSGIDTRLAIWCEVQKVIKLAKELDMLDCIISPESAFYRWVEQLCCNVGFTMNVIASGIYDDDPRQLAAVFDFAHTGGDTLKLRFKAPFWSETFVCETCQEQLLGIFYSYEDILNFHPRSRRPSHVRRLEPKCLRCRLMEKLNKEWDHFKLLERSVVGEWLVLDPRHPQKFSNTSDTIKALSQTHRLYALKQPDMEALETRRGYFFDELREEGEDWEQSEAPPFSQNAPQTTDSKDAPLTVDPGIFAGW